MSLTVLTGGARDLPPRQRTLRSTIDWSYTLLEPDEQQVFRQFAVFVGGCTLEAADAVCNASGDLGSDVLDVLASLVDKSLVRQHEGPDGDLRFVMLETLREYGWECSTAQGEIETLQRHHADFFLRLAEQADPKLQGREQAVWLKRLETEHDNLRAALRWAINRRETELACRLVDALYWFWVRRSYLSEGRRWFAEVLALASDAQSTRWHAQALYGAGGLAWLQGDYVAAWAFAADSVALWRGLEDKRRLAYALKVLGLAARLRGDLSAARAHGMESVALFRELEDRWGLAFALFCLGLAVSQSGDHGLAGFLYDESVALYRQIGAPWGIAMPLNGLGLVAYHQGNYAHARSRLEEGLTMLRDVEDTRSIAFWLNTLGNVVRCQGNIERATALYTESLALYRELGNDHGIADALHNLACVAQMQGDAERATALYTESLALYRESGSKIGMAICLAGLAAIAGARGKLPLAARLSGAVAALCESAGTPMPPSNRADYDRHLAGVRARLDQGVFATTWEEGRTMPLEQAVLEAQEVMASEQAIETPILPTVMPSSTYPAGLTAREVEVLRLVAQGLTNAQVAEILVITPRTVNVHLTSIYSKLQVTSRTAATRYAIEHNLI
jgi:DNA-binding CsgD family transcriptional regulator/tetratricopeptide (TPR) repeat protein